MEEKWGRMEVEDSGAVYLTRQASLWNCCLRSVLKGEHEDKARKAQPTKGDALCNTI